MKAGWKTSEFWLSLMAALLGGFLASGLLPAEHIAMKIAGMALTALASLGYAVSRGHAKAAQANSRPGEIDRGYARLGAQLLVLGVLGLVALLTWGCGLSAVQRLQLAGSGVERAWRVGHPRWDAACQERARECRKASPTKLDGCKGARDCLLDACPPAKSCLAGLAAYKGALDAADGALTVAAPLVAADDKGANSWISKALAALARATAAAQAAGYLPGGIR